MGELKSPGKPFEISKRAVWEAWEKVKANKGAPGVDGVSIAEFEKDLKGNLYKIWNRMSSGTYFPPPVRAVEIPKPHGGGHQNSGCADRGRPDRADGGGAEAGEEGGADLPPGLLRVPAGRSALDAVAACRRRCWKTDWVIDLDIRKFFDSVPWDLMVKAVEAQHRSAVGGAVCEAVAARAAAAARRDLAGAGSGDPAGVVMFSCT